MHLGIDFDGTITDATGLRQRYAQERWAVELAAHEVMREGAVPTPKTAICRALGVDVLLDDNLNQNGAAYTEALLEAGTLPVLFELPYNRERERSDGLRAVSSWGAFANLVDELGSG